MCLWRREKVFMYTLDFWNWFLSQSCTWKDKGPWSKLYFVFKSQNQKVAHTKTLETPQSTDTRRGNWDFYERFVDMTDDGSKVRCCKEQYCIGTWNVRSMNQGKLEVVKLEMKRVNVNVLGISKLNGPEWVNLTQITIISTTVGKIPLEEME